MTIHNKVVEKFNSDGGEFAVVVAEAVADVELCEFSHHGFLLSLLLLIVCTLVPP
jgi:hypothetical protein